MTSARQQVREPATARGGRVNGGAVPWKALPIRLLVVIPPAQILGVLAVGQFLSVAGLLREHPGLANAFPVGSGVIVGLALGAFVTPVRGRLPTYAAFTAAFAVASFALLLALARLRVPDVVEPAWYTTVLAVALSTGLQTAVACGLWVFRHRLR